MDPVLARLGWLSELVPRASLVAAMRGGKLSLTYHDHASVSSGAVPKMAIFLDGQGRVYN